MPTYLIELKQDVTESTMLTVQAHSEEQAELIAQWIAENGKDPGDRSFIDVTWSPDEVRDGPEVISCHQHDAGAPCNHMPEHTAGLWKDDAEDNAA